MNTSLRGELTKGSSSADEKYEFTNNDMVMAVSNYLNATEHDDVQHIKNSLSPVLLNSVASSVSFEFRTAFSYLDPSLKF